MSLEFVLPLHVLLLELSQGRVGFSSEKKIKVFLEKSHTKKRCFLVDHLVFMSRHSVLNKMRKMKLKKWKKWLISKIVYTISYPV